MSTDSVIHLQRKRLHLFLPRPRHGGRQAGNSSSLRPQSVLFPTCRPARALHISPVSSEFGAGEDGVRARGWVGGGLLCAFTLRAIFLRPSRPLSARPPPLLRDAWTNGLPWAKTLMLRDLGHVAHLWAWMLSIEEYVYFFRKEKFQLQGIISTNTCPWHHWLFVCLLTQWLSTVGLGGDFILSRGRLAVSGGHFGRHKWRLDVSVLWVEARDTTKHPVMNRAPSSTQKPRTKNYPAPNVSSQ